MNWIKIEDKLPDNNRSVIIAVKGFAEAFQVDYNSDVYCQGGFWLNENDGEYSTEYHPEFWMYMPYLPF